MALDEIAHDGGWTQASRLNVFINDGSGRFGGPLQYATGSDPTSMIVQDLNGDGRVDIAVATSRGAVSVLIMEELAVTIQEARIAIVGFGCLMAFAQLACNGCGRGALTGTGRGVIHTGAAGVVGSAGITGDTGTPATSAATPLRAAYLDGQRRPARGLRRSSSRRARSDPDRRRWDCWRRWFIPASRSAAA